ncbi:MAG: hypothetical protein CFH43_00855, partial [Proteobacteria bacterium]
MTGYKMFKKLQFVALLTCLVASIQTAQAAVRINLT